MEPGLVNILFTIIGFLFGALAVYPTLLKKQNRMELEVNTNRKDIEKLSEGIAHIERHMDQYATDSVEMKKLLNKHLDQNNQLIQAMIARNKQ